MRRPGRWRPPAVVDRHHDSAALDRAVRRQSHKSAEGDRHGRALPSGRATNSAITAVIVTRNAKPMTTVTAGPLNDLPSRTPSAMPTPTRNRRSISAMTKHYPPQAERVPLSASASRYQRRNMATGSKNRRHSRNPSEIIPARPYRSHGRPPGMSSESVENFLLPAILHPRAATTPAIWRVLCVAA